MMKDFARDVAVSRRPIAISESNSDLPLLATAAAHAIPLSRPEPRRRTYGRYRAGGKRVLDVMLVMLSLPVTLPVIGLCALALLLESGLPFYTQYRLGRMGRRFKILKLRTMVRDADDILQDCLDRDPALRAEWEETQKLKNDPRITKVGAFLRATSLDELPQIWNVLKGDMSLVGPRPMMPQQLAHYGDPRAYFSLRPGLTGSWQVAGRNDHAFETRRTFDAEYHRFHDLKEDVSIIWKTVFVVMQRTGY